MLSCWFALTRSFFWFHSISESNKLIFVLDIRSVLRSNYFRGICTNFSLNVGRSFSLHRENQELGEGADAVVTVKNVLLAPKPNVHFIAHFQNKHGPVRSVHFFMVAVVIVGSHYSIAIFAKMDAHTGLSGCKSREAKVVYAFHRSGELSSRMKASSSETEVFMTKIMNEFKVNCEHSNWVQLSTRSAYPSNCWYNRHHFLIHISSYNSFFVSVFFF